MKQVYLDHNATTKIDPLVLKAMWECYQDEPVNASSQHASGRAARRVVELARETIAELLDARAHPHQSDLVIFTSGGTEANNLAVFGIAGQAPGRIIVSAIEHPSVLAAAQRQSQLGFDVQQVNVTREGVCDIDHLKSLLTDDTRLVSLMFANNETGVIQPVTEAVAACSDRNIPLHCDAVQAIGKVPVSFREHNLAAMTVTPHKFHGPRGVGALILRHDVSIEPTMFGGAQQFAMRPGTEPVALVVGMAAALKIAFADKDRSRRMRQLRGHLEDELKKALPDCRIIGEFADRLPHTSNVAFAHIDRQAFLMALDMVGVSISTGSACASGSSEPSHVLIAMGCESAEIDGSLRISLGAGTTLEEVDLALGHIIRIATDLRQRK